MKTGARPEEKDSLAALARKYRLRGVTEGDLERRLGLSPERALALAQELEAEGEILILSFQPLWLILRSSIEILRTKIKDALERHHRNRPSDPGLPADRLRKRFSAPRQIFSLALKSLLKEAVVVEEDERLRLSSFAPCLAPRDEKLLARLEEACLREGYSAAVLDAFRAEHRLSPGAMDKMLTVLVGRKKIVRGREGLYLHSQWLEEVVAKIRSLPGKEMSVADFKAVTGLSRKFAIPLLELLDRMGVTRRRGSTREIVPEGDESKMRRKE
ncbi:MAG: SelB C-terminal domain-containing protein [Candidatus Aminicenantes bacterium]|nr:SelB C-terminal domain-containing protein [Candidatus Aminicenantes bacterium]